MSADEEIIEQVLGDYQTQLGGLLLKRKNGNGSAWPHEVTAVSRFVSRRLYYSDLDIAYMKERGVIKSRRFSGQFEYYVGIKPNMYINKHRVNASKKLLSRPKLQGLSISKIAYHTGYCRPSTYIKAFKRQEDIPPGKWRRKKLG